MEELKQLINKRLGLAGLTDVNPDLVDIATYEIVQKVKTYCNIKKIPEELHYVVSRMVMELIQSYLTQIDIVNNAPSPLEDFIPTSISVGDTSVSLKDPKSVEQPNSNKHTPEADDIIQSYRIELNAFRKLRW